MRKVGGYIAAIFILVTGSVSGNELNDILRQIVVRRVAQRSPEVGQILNAATQPKQRVYVAPNTTIAIGSSGYNNSSPSIKMYPEPQTAGDYVVYGKMLGNAGKIEDAAQYFLIARNMEPDNPEARYGLAMALALLGQQNRAKEEYNALQRITKQLIIKTNKISQLLERNNK